MFTVKNNLNQPLTIGDAILAAGGKLRVRSLDDDVTRLQGKGHVTVAADAEQVPPKAPEPPKATTKPQEGGDKK
jgi:hypothetical protein